MVDFFTKLTDTADFPARWHCGLWSTGHGFTHIISDIAISSAYAAIPCILVFFVLRRRDFPFLPVFWLFGAFIFFCGLGHAIEASIFWNPWYRLSAAVKVCTAITSWATVFALVPVIPKALALPNLVVANEQLRAEVEERRNTENRLQQSYAELRRFTINVTDREERIMKLKGEVNTLMQELGREPRYAQPVG